MAADAPTDEVVLVTPAEIAAVAGVTRAAVSNWRRRYPSFPAPVSGAARTARFSLREVDAWLERHQRTEVVAPEVRVWQALRGQFGDDIVRGLAAVSEFLVTGKKSGLLPETCELVREWAAPMTLAEAIEGLVERYRDAPVRAGSSPMTTPPIVRAVRHFAGKIEGTVFDPACGLGSLLLAVADQPGTTLLGQDIDGSAAKVAAFRLETAGRADARIQAGDSLREDAWPDLRANLVVCDPPMASGDWGRDDLVLDPRWEFGVPTRAEGELAWLQHCYAHTAAGGRVVAVLSASASYRKAGRRIRAELVRRGVVTDVVALPAGVAASHGQPVHLWVLQRPKDPGSGAVTVRMTDLSAQDPDGDFAPKPAQYVKLPLIDLLDDEVDLSPGPRVAASRGDHLVDYKVLLDQINELLPQLAGPLPSLQSGDAFDGTTLRVADLVRAGLVEVSGDTAVSTSDQLDTDYLQGFLRSVANVRRATSGSGSFRVDVPGARIPQLPLAEQSRYGAAFRSLEEFESRLTELARLGERAVALAREGLTLGALKPESPRTRRPERAGKRSARRTKKH